MNEEARPLHKRVGQAQAKACGETLKKYLTKLREEKPQMSIKLRSSPMERTLQTTMAIVENCGKTFFHILKWTIVSLNKVAAIPILSYLGFLAVRQRRLNLHTRWQHPRGRTRLVRTLSKDRGCAIGV